MKIRPVKSGSNRYCGPAVLSSLLNIDTGEAARRIREVSDRAAIKSTYTWELIKVLDAAGYSVKTALSPSKKDRPTLAGWLKSSVNDRTAGRVFLILAGHHYQLISGRRYVCGMTKNIVSVRDKQVRRRARVERVWEILAQ